MNLPSNQDDLVLLLHAYADGELDAATVLAMERKLASDNALARELSRILALKQAVAAKLPRDSTSEALRARITGRVPRRSGSRGLLPSDWRQLAAALLVGLALGIGAPHLLGRAPKETLLEDMVNNHRRALLAAQPVDVASSDRHTVRPWFESKLALSVPAVDLADKGFPLIGGRVDIAGGNPAASLVYRAGEHMISLTVLPAATPGEIATDAPRWLSFNGFDAVEWRAGGRVYWAVSDTEPANLAAFVAAFRATAAH
jgi:anti-sigma factor RsiW